MEKEKPLSNKSLLVKILQWFYLLLAICALAAPFVYHQQPSLVSLGFPKELIFGLGIAVTFYCLLLFVSFLTQNSNLVIFALVFIFFTTIGGIVLLLTTVPNLNNLLSSGLPACTSNIASCSFKDGIIVAAAGALAVALPILLLNIITIIGSVKAISAGD